MERILEADTRTTQAADRRVGDEHTQMAHALFTEPRRWKHSVLSMSGALHDRQALDAVGSRRRTLLTAALRESKSWSSRILATWSRNAFWIGK